ncbi:MAG: ATP-binding protein [Polyangiaceae bacterium]|nr:ATP-binding protein [Polyangiaceae bacterium]
MVAPVDIYIYFAGRALFELLGDAFESRPSVGGGVIRASWSEKPLSNLVEEALAESEGAPVGVVVHREVDALRAIEYGADEAVHLKSRDEVEVTRFLDRVLVRARSRRAVAKNYQEFAQAEKLTALGAIVAGVGHELNNPLSTLILGLDFLKDSVLPDIEAICSVESDEAIQGQVRAQQVQSLVKSLSSGSTEVHELFDDVTESTTMVAQLVQDLRVFSRTSSAEEPTLFSPQDVIDQELRLVRRELGSHTVLEQDYGEELPDLFLQRNRLAQVVTNLLVNAVHAMRDVNRETHHIRIGARVDDDSIAVSITDTGPGISEHALERIFDPFYTTKREGQGTGLGLAISRTIMQEMGGDLIASSVYGEGATFVCLLPLPTEQERVKSAVASQMQLLTPSSAQQGSVLIIDDDEQVLRAMARTLRKHYKLLVARDGQEAKELLESGSQADVIITELDLPEVDGPGFISWLCAAYPSLSTRVVIATAAQERKKYRDFLRGHGGLVLHKPFDQQALLQAVRHVVESSSRAYGDVRVPKVGGPKAGVR